MKTNPNMIGKWKGTYNYFIPKEYKGLQLNPVEFEVEIVAMENECFTGKVQDNVEMGGMPGVGEIIGNINNGLIVFEKNMPFETMLTKNGDQITKKNKKHPTIVYSGKLESDKRIIQGKWKFKKLKFMWISLIPWWYDLGNGTFTMQKID